MHRIAISGLAALAAVLGGVAVPAAAMAQSSVPAQSVSAVRSVSAARSVSAVRSADATALREARTALAAAGDGPTGEPLISCVLTSDCLGGEGSSSLTDGESVPTRVARWNGTSWKGVGVTLPKGTKSADLEAISCKGAKSCLVVGDYYTSTGGDADNHALALAYNGTSLKPTGAVPLPKGTQGAELSGLSCVTTRDCVALGQAEGDASAFGAAGSLIVIETWNGAKWTLHTASAQSGKTYLSPSTIACATAAFCFVGGDAEVASSSTDFTSALYLASWNGRKLTAMKAAGLGVSGVNIAVPTGASCAAASNCAVTGADLSNLTSTGDNVKITAFTEIWNGKTWQLGQVAWPKADPESFTLGVSCYGARSCESVGIDAASDGDTASSDAAAVSFNGAAGAQQAVPAPSKGDSNALTDVSCLPWGSCVAVGETGKTTAKTPALMTGVWNGKAWKLDPGF